MSFVTSQPIFNKFTGGIDAATALRTHLLANAPNRFIARFRIASNAVAAAVRIHPRRLQKIMRRIPLITLDLTN